MSAVFLASLAQAVIGFHARRPAPGNEVKLVQPRTASAKAESSACQKLAFAILPSISAPNILRPTAYFDLCWNFVVIEGKGFRMKDEVEE